MPARRSIKVWTGHAESTPLADHPAVNPAINRLRIDDSAFHSWYRFVLSFPAHLVSEYLAKLGGEPGTHNVLDPFCGTGTTLVEAKKRGFRAFGVEGTPVPALAAHVKTDWKLSPADLDRAARAVKQRTESDFEAANLPERADLALWRPKENTPDSWTPPEEMLKLIPRGMISPLPLRRVLLLRKRIENVKDGKIRKALQVALAACLVEDIGNVGFGPEIYTTKPKVDFPVLEVYQRKTSTMIKDLQSVAGRRFPATKVLRGDARTLESLPDRCVDIVITSPPYPNEKDYTRTTRLETVLLGHVQNKEELQSLKRSLLRSNSRGVYRDDTDDQLVKRFPRILDIARRIEERRMSLGKDSGFERMYHRVVLLYFGGMMRHLMALKRVLRAGARLAYVVGDQMSYLMIPIPTGELLAEIADAAGYSVEGIDLWRTRLSTTSGVNLREEVVRLRLPEE